MKENRGNDIEKEYWMTRKQKIRALMDCFGYTRKGAEEWLRDAGE
jgi:hypothetical protein